MDNRQWNIERHLGRIRLDNYIANAHWRFDALAETDSWQILLRNEREGPYGTTIARVTIRKLSPNIYLSERLFVEEKYRGKGYSTKLFNVQWAFVTQILGGGVMMALVRDDNVVQQQRLQKLGWVQTTKYTDEECFEAGVWFYSSYGFVGPVKQQLPPVIISARASACDEG